MHELQPQLDAETKVRPQSFDKLLNLAVDTCLSDRKLYESHLDALRRENAGHKISELVAGKGLWGLRNEIDLLGKTKLKDETTETDFSDELVAKPNVLAQLKIEAFGQAIIEEAFTCLGDDAAEQAEKLANAKTEKQRYAIYNWLAGRLKAIQMAFNLDDDEALLGIDTSPADQAEVEPEPDTVTDESDKYFYHPIRLSPKAIGKFPNTQVDPTCLAYSILAASFFEKAGVPYLHAGVVRTHTEIYKAVWTLTADVVEDVAKEQGIELPDIIKAVIKEARDSHRKTISRDTGFHACVLSKYNNIRWAQTDPNYKSNALLSREDSKLLKGVNQQLRSFESDARGVELTLINDSSLLPMNHYDCAKELATRVKSTAEIKRFLKKAGPKTTIDDFIEYFLHDFIADDDERSPSFLQHKLEMKHFCKQAFSNDELAYELLLHKQLRDTINRYVFGDTKDSLEKSIKRCKTDPRYLERRVEDLKMLPFYALLSIQLNMGNFTIDGVFKAAHAVYEVGLPAYRIGASVLSDFAVYCEPNLPPSFWSGNWASQISVADHLVDDSSSPAQQEHQRQLVQKINDKHWTYYNMRGIISKFLEQGGDQ